MRLELLVKRNRERRLPLPTMLELVVDCAFRRAQPLRYPACPSAGVPATGAPPVAPAAASVDQQTYLPTDPALPVRPGHGAIPAADARSPHSTAPSRPAGPGLPTPRRQAGAGDAQAAALLALRTGGPGAKRKPWQDGTSPADQRAAGPDSAGSLRSATCSELPTGSRAISGRADCVERADKGGPRRTDKGGPREALGVARAPGVEIKGKEGETIVLREGELGGGQVCASANADRAGKRL
jgi:hypothetical protein